MRICHICGTECESWCPTCVDAFPARRAVSKMSPTERATELRSLVGPLEIPFLMLHQRIEELVGRPVWTHELARPGSLVDEIESGKSASMAVIIDKVPAAKRLVMICDTSENTSHCGSDRCDGTDPNQPRVRVPRTPPGGTDRPFCDCSCEGCKAARLIEERRAN